MKAHPVTSSGTKPAAEKPSFAKGFVYRGIEIRPYAITRLAQTREVYESMRNAAIDGRDEG